MGNVGRSVSGFVVLASFAAFGVGCAASPLAPVAPLAAPAPAASVAQTTLAVGIGDAAEARAEDSADEPAPLPTTCGAEGTLKDAKLCLPEATFAKKMCSNIYPDVALGMFGKGTPWTRIYLAGDVEAWNASGGRAQRAKLAFDEEVLVLKKRSGNSGGIQVSGTGGYLVMRWDGNCYTLEDSDLTTKKPPSPKVPPIPWRLLSDRTKDALLKSPKVLAAYQKRGKECKGAISGEVSRACEQADTALSNAIVSEIRGGLTLPTPDRLP